MTSRADGRPRRDHRIARPSPRHPYTFTPHNSFRLIPPPAAADPLGIDSHRTIVLFPALRRSSYRRRLWLLAAGVAVFLSIAAGGELLRRATTPAQPRPAGAPADNLFALDFIAFYTGGAMAADGRHRELFDLRAVKRFQDDLAARDGATLGDAVGPWWNPPFYAWVFAPLSTLPFGVATATWVALNVACVAIACWLLVRMLPPGLGWRTYALVPVLVLLSTPFIHTVTHGQNAGTSLLIVTVTVALWRANRPVLAGMVAGLMFYKPQHAVVLGGMLALSLGWRAAAGMAATGFALLVVTLVTLPGALGDFLHRMPKNVVFVQEACAYPWARHATIKAFWRTLLQGESVGPPAQAVLVLTALGVAAVAVGLLRLTGVMRWMNALDRTDRSTPAHRDRVIAATFLATPLLMPFYFDYDLLMLAVPAVLLANRYARDGRLFDGGRWDKVLLVAGPMFYAGLMLNADVAERTGVNVAVGMLGVLFAATALPRPRREAVAIEQPAETEMPLARAA